jgi:hypothetical protein
MVGRLKLAYYDLFYLQRWQTELIIEGHEIDLRDSWERERVAAYLSVAPHLKKNSGVTADKLWPLPWDSKALAKEFNMENIHERIDEFKKRVDEHKKRVAEKKNGKLRN